MAGKQFPLTLVISGVDRLTAPLGRMSNRLTRLTMPVRAFQASLSQLSAAAGVPRLVAGFSRVGGAVGGVANQVGRLTTRLGLLGAAAAVTFGAMVRRSVDAGDKLAKLADRLRLPIDVVAELQFVAGRAGIEEDVFDKALEQFSKRLGEAKLGTGPLRTLLKDNAPGLLRQLTATKSNADALDVMFSALGRVKDANLQAALGVAAFGRSGALFANLVEEDLVALRAEYRRLAGSQEAFARLMEPLNDQIGDLGIAFGGLKTTVMTALAPALTTLAKQLTEIFVSKRGAIGEWAASAGAAIGQFADSLPQRIEEWSQLFEAWRKKLQPIADIFGGWPNLLAAVGGAILGGPFLAAIVQLGAAIVGLGVAIGLTPVGWLLLGLAALGLAAVALTGKWETVATFFRDLWAGIKEGFMGTLEMIRGVLNLDVGRALKGARQAIGGTWKAGATTVTGLAGAADSAGAAIADVLTGRGSSSVPSPSSVDLGRVLGRTAQRSSTSAIAAEIARALRGSIDLQVTFKNTPPGTRVRAVEHGASPLDVGIGVGYHMPETMPSH